MRVVPADPALDALQELFPPTGAPDFVGESVKESMGIDVKPNQGELTYVRYRPTKSCVASWSFPTLSSQPLVVSGKLFNDEGGARTVARASFQRLIKNSRALVDEGAIPYRYLPDRQFLLQVFPIDIRLPGLLLAGSEAWVCDSLLRSVGVSEGQMSMAEATLVSYKPWRRCVYKYVLESQCDKRRYFAKLFRDDRGQRILAWLQAVRAQLLTADAAWDTPAPVAYIPEARMLVSKALEDGTELKDLITNAPGDPQDKHILRDQMVRVAESLDSFQRITVDGLCSITPTDLIGDLKKGAKALGHVAPTLAQTVQRQLCALEIQASQLPPEKMVLTHGAFRHDQLLLCASKLSILDLDTLCIAGSGADAGNFLGYLDRMVLRRRRLKSNIEECAETFMEALCQQGMAHYKWFAWHRAAANVKNALRSFFSLDKEWPETAEGLLRLAEQTLTTLRTNKVGESYVDRRP